MASRPGNRSNRPHIFRLNREKPEPVKPRLFKRNHPVNSRFNRKNARIFRVDLFYTIFTPNFFTRIFLHQFLLFYINFLPKNLFLNFKICCKTKADFLVKEKIGVKASKNFGVKNNNFGKNWCKKLVLQFRLNLVPIPVPKNRKK